MIERIRRARRLAQPSQTLQRSLRRRFIVPCATEHNIGPARIAIETVRKRLTITGAILGLAFAVTGIRLVEVSLMQEATEPRVGFAPKASPCSRKM